MEIITSARKTHGLSHQDYARYVHHTAVKVRKLLKQQRNESKENVTLDESTLVKDSLPLSLTSLLLLLFKTEREWANALAFKQEISENPRKKHHAIKKLKRAVNYSQELVSLVLKDKELIFLNQMEVLQVQAYACFQKGLLLLEQQDWQKALDELSQAR